MPKRLIAIGLLCGLMLATCAGLYAQAGELVKTTTLVSAAGSSSANHDELVELFFAWREFHAPEMKDGIPDYSAEAMARQYRELAGWQHRLAAIDTAGWPIAHQIDWFLVWAEMNGLDFAHRVKKPWSRDPAFYVWFYPSPTDVPNVRGRTSMAQSSCQIMSGRCPMPMPCKLPIGSAKRRMSLRKREST